MLRILQRYALREIIGPSLLGLLVFTLLLFVAEIFRTIKLLVNTSVTWLEAIELIGCILPALLPVTIPMSLLMGVLLGVGRLASEGEITAIRSSGINLMGIVWPILGFCSLMTLAMILAGFSLTPFLNLQAEDVGIRVLFKMASSLEPGRVHKDFGGADSDAALYFWNRDSQTGRLQAVAMMLGRGREDNPHQKEALVFAPEGTITPNIADVSVRLLMANGSLHVFTPDHPEEYDIATFESLARDVRLDIVRRDSEGKPVKKPKMMTVRELTDSIQAKGAKDRNVRRWKMELAQRFSIPFACVAVVLLGIPLAVHIRPSANILGFAIALGLTFIYFVVLKCGFSLGMSGSPLGVYVVFSPNFLLGGIGAVLMVRMIRQ